MTNNAEPAIKVLIVDDEPHLRTVLAKSLSAARFRIWEAATGEMALASLEQNQVDIALLDINMPGFGGLETCRRIAEREQPPGIIMVTVRDTEDEKVEALESGADDFITKPFLLRELIARIRAVHRRRNAAGPKPSILRAGDLQLDLNARTLRKAGVEIHLTPREFEVLAALMQNQDAPITNRKLLTTVWGAEYGGEHEYVRSYVKMLRKKIEDDPANPKYILTEPWAGYRFCNSSSETDARSNGSGDV